MDEESKALKEKCMDKINAACERIDSFMKEKNRELQLKQDWLEKKDMESSQRVAGIKTEVELLTNKVHDLETKLEIKIKDENKLQTMIVEQYATMKEEINKMRSEIDETQKQNQNLLAQVSALRRSIAKLEKSKEKLEYNYEKKLTHAIKNKDVEIRTLQLRLKEQENELCTSLSTKKQNEVDNIASTLEKRYKMLLAQTEAMSESQTQEYLRKIANLEDQVLNMKRL
ncbi:centrosome-associated protein CEP250-like isoform X2 [Ceratina calcarata]|uniref:Centrosome-associated protein CEP250-like isoform X2 n=1 Tax=Ceratina calcarata TaxID=156304 RepID=A0AAJ7IRV2_9HYME|nr:centrosome-associated protein CEP250-like isoform X2 [Ceratina calcarata]